MSDPISFPGGGAFRPPRLSTVFLAIGVSTLLAGCAEEPARAWRGPGTIRMAERLQQIAVQVEPETHPYMTSARLDSVVTTEAPSDFSNRLRFNASIAREELHVGRTEEAIARFEELVAEVASRRAEVPLPLAVAIVEALGTARLKHWELESCVTDPATRPCLFPIEADGSRLDADMARSAATAQEFVLQVQPDDLGARWLLNLSYMMLGEYPDGVPEAFVIPPDALRAEYDVGRFPDIASELGLDVTGHLGGSIMDDLDGDGDLDIVASSWHLGDQLRLFRNDADGTFTDVTIEAGLEGIVGGINLVQADYDNDGFLDIFVLRGAWTPHGEPNSLLRNNGDGTFEDVTEQAALLSTHPTQTASWGDYDGDGWLDLYIGNESVSGPRIPNQLFHNNQDGTFTDVASEAGAAVIGFVKAVVWGDIDNDGMLDLFISRLREPNVLLRNEGPDADGRWSFSDVTATAGVAEPISSFPAWFWDYDDDGWLDIFVSDYSGTAGDLAAEYLGLSHEAELPRLYRNAGDGTFSDVTAEARLERVLLTMGSNYGDLDNDGHEDFYAGTGEAAFNAIMPNRMFRNSGGEFFQDVTESGGFGHIGKGHGVSFGDLDQDGDQDIYATMGGAHEGDIARNVLFENPGHGNHWITLRLEGTRSNRSAIGARVKVIVQTEAGSRELYRTVSSGGTFGANSLQQEIGLGNAVAIESVEITWPATGVTDSFTRAELDQVYRVREGDSSLTRVRVTPFRLTGTDGGAGP